MDKVLAEYRKSLIDKEMEIQEDFDKALLALSGGALGISFAFIKDIVGNDPVVHPDLLVLAWILWGFSSSIVLLSYYSSRSAFRKAIVQLDKNEDIYEGKPGGFWDDVTGLLNFIGMVLFFAGVAVMAYFVRINIGVFP